MAIFNLNPITSNTDINVTLFNNMIAGINEALAIQDASRLYCATTAFNVYGSEFILDQSRPYNYYYADHDLTFSSFLPSNISFAATPFVIAKLVDGEVLFSEKKKKNISSTGCKIWVGRWSVNGVSSLSVQVLAVGPINVQQ